MDKVAPVYRDYTRLLLSSSSPNIQKAIQVNEQPKLQKTFCGVGNWSSFSHQVEKHKQHQQ